MISETNVDEYQIQENKEKQLMVCFRKIHDEKFLSSSSDFSFRMKEDTLILKINHPKYPATLNFNKIKKSSSSKVDLQTHILFLEIDEKHPLHYTAKKSQT